jgi:hypothetical protein
MYKRTYIGTILAVTLAASAVILGQYAGNITVDLDPTRTGEIYTLSPSQILPATYLTFFLSDQTFPMASAETPSLIVILLPESATLSQTLATGTRQTTAPLPTQGETVIPLAVVEYHGSGKERVPAGPAAIGSNAIQILRYVAGEHTIWIRLNESPTTWTPSQPYNYWGFTIGIGGGVWPNVPTSNWGPDGMFRQQSTLFIADVRDYNFPAMGYYFYASFSVQDQHTGQYIPAYFEPQYPSLFQASNTIDWELPVMSAIGSEVTDFVTGDLNRDGYDDICSIDGMLNRLYWSWGQPDNTFAGLDWVETVGVQPVTVDMADVTGDGWLDCLVSDSTGMLHVYRWEDLFSPQAKETRTIYPTLSVRLAGVPSDSTVHDVDLDGTSDYIFSDKTSNTLTILLGGDFTTQVSYAAGSNPVALTVGDFNGDHAPDVALANNGSDTISVYWNDGAGNLTRIDFPAGGTLPVDIDAADFDRNGRVDLAFATSGNRMLSVWKAQPSGTFDPAQAQKLFFQKTPSALIADNFDALGGPDVLMGFSDNDRLAFCTFDDTDQFIYAYSINTLGDVVVDPTSGATLAESSVLSVAGGTAAGGVSSRNGVAGLTQQSFDVVIFPRSQDLSFSVVNLGANEALLNMELYDDSGTFKSSSTQPVPPNNQFPRYFPDLLGTEANQAQRWVRSFITQPDTHGLWLANNGTDLTYLDGLRTPSIRDALFDFILPVIQTGGGFNTQWILINPNLEQAHVTIRLMGSDGTTRATSSLLLNGRGRVVLDAPVVFPGVSQEDYLTVNSDRPILGCELFGNPQTLATMDPMVAGVNQGILYSPHVAVGDFGGINYQTSLTVINTSAQNASLILTLYNDAGHQIASYPWFQIGAHSKRVRDLGSLMSLPSGTTGYLKIDPQGAAGILGTVTFGETGAGRFQSCLPLQTPARNKFLLGHLANGALGEISFYTGIAVVNPENDTKVISLKAYDQYGMPLDSQNLTLQARSRQVFLLSQVMPGLSSIFGGYMIIENKTPSAGTLVFELFGDNDFNFLSAVPAVPLD